jgi:hypothetical protein
MAKMVIAIGPRNGAVFCVWVSRLAQDLAPRQRNWPSSEYHRKLDGNGNIIPCRCLFKDKSHPLGTTICMNTHKGTVLAECDLVQNNTSWVPTDEPCTISQAPIPRHFVHHNYPLNKQGLSTN